MFQVRIHGRGGQGVVSAAELLALAACIDKHHAQAFPSFGFSLHRQTTVDEVVPGLDETNALF